MKTVHLAALGVASALLGCDAPVEERAGADSGSAEAEQVAGQSAGARLFERETFDGNGRTCATCHDSQTGTISPGQVQARFNQNPSQALFRSIDSDDGVGNQFTLLKRDATIRVTIPLPANWALADAPSATSVTFRRGVSTTLNVPSLDTIFMADGRNPSVQSQALGAVNAHYQPGRQPTASELNAIAAFEQTDDFFSSEELEDFAEGGPPPELPLGTTESEQRGRVFFVDGPAGQCALCHSGPMLNQTNEFFPAPPGGRFSTVFVSEFNRIGQPQQAYTFTPPGGGDPQTFTSPDPGRALITGDPADFNLFRIPTLWGIKKTAPYFHDNSAKSLAELTAHYSDVFAALGLGPLSAQQQADIVAYMQLL